MIDSREIRVRDAVQHSTGAGALEQTRRPQDQSYANGERDPDSQDGQRYEQEHRQAAEHVAGAGYDASQ